VTSIEHDPEWVKKVIDRCPAADIRLVSGTTHGRLPAEPQHRNAFKLEEKGQQFFDDYVAAIDTFEEGSLDIVIVDGMCRMECVRRGASKVKPGGVLIVDDTDYRFGDPEELLPGWHAVGIWGFKTTRDLRETTFFHKPEVDS
jgi:hypothetical protein